MNCTQHAWDRYREHHPEAMPADVYAAVRGGVIIDGALAATLCGRRAPTHSRTSYSVAPDRWGMFAVEGERVITYLRFGPSQREFCVRHYGAPPPAPATVELPPLPVKRKAAFRYRLGHLLLHRHEAMEPRYLGEMERSDHAAIRTAVLDGPVEVGDGAVRFVVAGRRAVARAQDEDVAVLAWESPA